MAWTCYTCQTKNPNSSAACKQCGGNVAAPSNFYLHWVFGGAAFFFVAYLFGVFVGGTLVEASVAPTEEAILKQAQEVAARTVAKYETADYLAAKTKQSDTRKAAAQAQKPLLEAKKALAAAQLEEAKANETLVKAKGRKQKKAAQAQVDKAKQAVTEAMLESQKKAKAATDANEAADKAKVPAFDADTSNAINTAKEIVDATKLGSLKTEIQDEARKTIVDKAKEEMSGVKYLLMWFLPLLLFLIFGFIIGFISDGKTIKEAAIGSVVGQIAGFCLLRFVFDAEITWIALAIGTVVGAGLAVLGSWQGEIVQERKERTI